MKVAFTFGLLQAACQGGASNCEKLAHHAPSGVTLASDETECAEILSFTETVGAQYGMDFQTWLSVVAAQPVALTHDAVFALVGGSWTPESFGPVPIEVPCGRGVPVTDDLWSNSPLSQILKRRPTQLFVSLSVEIPPTPGDVAAIRMHQNFDCNDTVGIMELVGEFRVGVPVLAGGWQLMSSKTPLLTE